MAGGAFVGLCFIASCASKGPAFEPLRIQRGAVVCEHPIATQVGLDILNAGGNAADAAVAVSFALAVVYPNAGNLGGGGFALVVEEGKSPTALDFREVAPADTDPKFYLDAQGQLVSKRSVRGPLSVGVPGSTAGMFALYKQHGSGNLVWSDLIEPARRLAAEGFGIDAHMAEDLLNPSVQACFNQAALDVFYPGGATLKEGELLVQKDLAKTLKAIAVQGPSAFYKGPIATAMLQVLAKEPLPDGGAAQGGVITAKDLEGYSVRWMKPLLGSFQGMELICMPPPSSGGLVILQALAVLEGLPQMAEAQVGQEDEFDGFVSENLLHWWIEALRRAFADRAEHMGDPDFHDVPVAQLLSPEWILERRVSIGSKADLSVGAWTPRPATESAETTHLSVVDIDGGAVSMTTTLNGSYGSGIMVEGAGFLLNNELDDFSIMAGVPNQFGLIGNEANAIEPGKRPLSSMSPVIVRDGDGAIRLVLGSPGGPRIITAVFQVLLRVLLLEQDLPDALAASRFHQQWRPETTWFEGAQGPGWDPALLERLRKRGHPIEVRDSRAGSVQAILIGPDGWPTASSDPRRGGAGGVQGKGIAQAARP